MVPEGRHVGEPIRLTTEQRSWLHDIYGSPTRVFILSMGRKNGKTAFCAMLLLLHLCGPEYRRNSNLYSTALSRDQAAILFSLAAKMVRLSPDLASVVQIRDTAKQLLCPPLGTSYRALSADASTAYGLSPVFVVHDELGQVRGPRSELYEALETATAAQEEPLTVIISTQAPEDTDLLSLLIDDGLKGADPRVKVRLYTAPVSDPPFALSTIRKANPHLDSLMNETEVMRQASEARRMPAREAAYRNLILNQRVSEQSAFISRSVWEACAEPADEQVFHRYPAWIGVDLSSRNDLTAVVMVAMDEQRVWHVRPWFFAPRLGLEERAHRDRVPYDLWERQGVLVATPGASVDYSVVAQHLIGLCSDHRVIRVAFDRWRIDVLRAELARLGADLPLEPFGQGFRDMGPAVDMLEAELLNRRLRHGNHPVLNWCAANAIVVRDPAGSRKLDKARATGRIDGIVALLMALGAAARHVAPASPRSVYDERGVRFL